MMLKERTEKGQLDLFCGGFPWWIASTTEDRKAVSVELSYPDGSSFGAFETLTFKTWGKAHAFLKSVGAVNDGEPTPVRDSYLAQFKR